MDVRHLRTLVAIADHGSFAAAADVLGLTQSAISLHVKGLEDAIGRPVFDRTTRPPRLNAEGRAVVAKARTIIDLTDDLTRTLGSDDLSGTLAIGAVATAMTGILPDVLAALRAKRPQIKVRVSGGLSGTIAAKVRDGSLDVGLVSRPMEPEPELRFHSITNEPLRVIAPADMPGDDDRTILESGPYIRFQRLAWAGNLIDASLRDRGIRVQTMMEVDTLEAVALMVQKGLGVSIVPERTLEKPFPDRVRVVPFGDPPIHRTLGLIERNNNPKIRLSETLLDECRTRVAVFEHKI